MRKRGTSQVELAAGLVLGLPIIIGTAFVCYEVVLAYMIENALNKAAHSAAMTLAKAYGSDPTVATSAAKQTTYLNKINNRHLNLK